jgi:exopolysaccharide biosynthesis protein
MFKRILIAMSVSAVAVCFCLTTAYAFSPLYSLDTEQTVSRGVTYESSRMVTDAGLLDVHVLRVPLNDPYISVGPVEDTAQYGLRETTTQLLSGAGALAGVNASFFGTANRYSAGFGPIISDNRLISVSADTNANGDSFASLFINTEGVPFLSFLKTGIHFYNNGEEKIEVHSINKITDMVYPVAITNTAMADTSQLDARFPGLMKIVVSGSTITYISQNGETVAVPTDGYVIAIQRASADYDRSLVSVGQRAVLQIEPTGVDFANVRTAVGGGGLILQNGQAVSIGEITTPNTRAPRTALGITQDKAAIVLVQVDGRGYSIGATHADMADIMRRYGAYDAMELDGGGSSTMAVTDTGDGSLAVVNNVSDGTQRNVINALGVFNSAAQGPVQALKIELSSENIELGQSSQLKVYGLDENNYRIELPSVGVEFDTQRGQLLNGAFTPSQAGDVVFTAEYQGLTASATLKVAALAELDCTPGVIKLEKNASTDLSFTAIDSAGRKADITGGVAYEVNPPGLGSAANGVFTALTEGTGYLRCTAGGVSTYVPVSIGDTGQMPLAMPASPKFRDPWRIDFAAAAPIVTIAGNAGDMSPITYSSALEGGVLHIKMTASNGGLISTDSSQWQKFTSDIDASGAADIIIEMNLNPNNFTKSQEERLFHDTLVNYQAKGKNILVVSKQGQNTTTTIEDNIHYVNLADRQMADGAANPDYRVMKVYLNGNQMIYALSAD